MKHTSLILLMLCLMVTASPAQITPTKSPTQRPGRTGTPQTSPNPPIGESDTYNPVDATRLRREISDAWRQSEKYSLVIAEQMPAEDYFFKSTDSTMTYTDGPPMRQWRHCMLYTYSQLAGRLDVPNPYKNKKPVVLMPKEQLLEELRQFYKAMQETIQTIPAEKLNLMTTFPDGDIPGWRLFYALENHIIHHRGQCIVYLRLKGIHPKGYYGW